MKVRLPKTPAETGWKPPTAEEILDYLKLPPGYLRDTFAAILGANRKKVEAFRRPLIAMRFTESGDSRPTQTIDDGTVDAQREWLDELCAMLGVKDASPIRDALALAWWGPKDSGEASEVNPVRDTLKRALDRDKKTEAHRPTVVRLRFREDDSLDEDDDEDATDQDDRLDEIASALGLTDDSPLRAALAHALSKTDDDEEDEEAAPVVESRRSEKSRRSVKLTEFTPQYHHR